MATSKEFHDYIVENLRRVGEVSTRKMMGEYCVYYEKDTAPGGDGVGHRRVKKHIGDICGNCLLLKPVDSVLRLLPDAERAYPYEGSKSLMVVVDDVENTRLMAEVLDGMYGELPEPKPRKPKA